MYNYIISFLTRNLRHKQVEKDFNSPGELEVSMTSLSEIVANGILHRSYVIEAPLRVFIFDNRIEIHSPGLLPEGVNLENILHGASVPRNKLLFNHGINLLPYTGAGSGITRALKFTPDIKFVNDETLNEFVVTMEREGVNDRDDDRDDGDKSLENSDLKKIGKQGNDRDDRVKHAGVSYKALDGTQKNIIQFCSIPRSAREILEHIGYSYHPTHIAKFIKPLLKLGFIEMTEPDKPNSKNQKYRICQVTGP
jgi:predicted HTH transcriptional regulator